MIGLVVPGADLVTTGEGCLIEDDFLDYLGQRLTLAARARVEAHLDRCPLCGGVVVEYTRGLDAGTPSLEDDLIAIGDRVGRFVIIEWLGAGGMGVVYKAFDPDLDRNIALKVLHEEEGHSSDALLREAKLAAQVASTRVVAIYDVGVDRGRIFLAMELVQGATLSEWCRPDIPLDSVLAVVVEAGEGLAAAHRAGIVHGDFKPANVLVGDGHAKVTDFGLGGGTDASEASRTGGTPRYMGPDQATANGPSALADQFSFAVTAWEVLTGSHPFLGEGEAGPLTPARRIRGEESARSIPRRIRKVLERALAFDPTERFSDMDALLAALRPRRRRTVWLSVAFASLLAVVAFARSELTRSSDPCAGMTAHLRGIWDASQKETVRQRLLETKLPFAAPAWSAVEQSLDEFTARWLEQRSEICRMTSVRKEQSEAVLDARMGCLDDELRQVRFEITVASHIEPKELAPLVASLSQLPRPERCRNVTTDGRFKPPDAKAAELFEATKMRLAEAEALRWNFRRQAAIEPARVAVAGAHELGWMAGEAYALAIVGAGELWNGGPTALTTLTEALERAEDADDRASRADILLQTMSALVEADHAIEASAIAPVAHAAVRRMGNDAASVARYENTLGRVEDARGNHARAAERFHAAANAFAAQAGPDDFWVLAMRSNEARALSLQGRPDLAVIEHEDVLERLTRRYGLHPVRAKVLVSLADAHLELHRFEDALRTSDLAAEMLSSLGDEATASQAVNLAGRGLALAGVGRTKEGLAALRAARDIRARLYGPKHTLTAELLMDLAHVHAQRGESELAATATRQALDIYDASEKREGIDHALVIVEAVKILVALGDDRGALPLAEVALRELRGGEQVDTHVAEAEFLLARLLVKAAPRDPRIGQLAQHARAVRLARPWIDVDIGELDGWSKTRAAESIRP